MPRKVVHFKEVAAIQLTSFLDAYKKAFVQMFSDSGIWSEEMIIEQYRKSAQDIYSLILGNILLKLSGEKVLGRKKVGESFEIIFYVGSRLIVVVYSENKHDNERIVESINIGRKSIIF